VANRMIITVHALMGLAIVAFAGAAFLRILTFAATSGVVVALFSAQTALLGFDMQLQQRKVAAALAFVPAVAGLLFALFLFF
jgi:hypothetical protein